MWVKKLVLQKKFGPNSWRRKKSLVHTASGAKNSFGLYHSQLFFCGTSWLSEISFAPIGAWTRLILHRQLFGPHLYLRRKPCQYWVFFCATRLSNPLVLRNGSNYNFWECYSKLFFTYHKIFDIFSHQLGVPSLCNHNKYWVNLPFQFWF